MNEQNQREQTRLTDLPAFKYFSGGGNRWIRFGLAFAALAAYVLAFIPPFAPEDLSIVELAATPVVVAAWLLGFWGGLLASLVAIPFNAVLLTLLNGTDQTFTQVLSQGGVLEGSILLLILGAVLGGLRDIADQMRREILARTEVEEARRESEERYRFVAESASDGIITIAADLRILFANRAAEKIFGLTITELVGRPFSMLIPERVREAHERALKQYLETVITSNPQYALQIAGETKSGAEIALEISFGEYVKNEEHVFTGIVRDVTERKQLEQVLKRAKEQAERANQAKSEFLSRMSHELRTPLNAILGFAQLLEMDELNEEQQESVDQILKAGRHLLALVDEVLDIARIEAGRVSLSPEPLHVTEVVSEAWALVRQRADHRGINMNGKLAETCDCHVLADRQRLKQVLLNLLSNAVKYNQENGRIDLACESVDGDRIRVSVTDTGVGIPEENLSRLFTPFERLGAERTGVEGTGIGLALSKGLVEAMNGRIGATSTVGEGSTFYVELPKARAVAEEREAALTAVEEMETAPDIAEAVILYIEDNPSNFKLVERVLGRRPGVKLLTAMQGQLGLELAREHRPDLILLDLNLPDMHGSELLRRLQGDQDLSETPVVVISADVTTGQIQRILNEGAQAYLPKPLDVQEFLSVVDGILTG